MKLSLNSVKTQPRSQATAGELVRIRHVTDSGPPEVYWGIATRDPDTNTRGVIALPLSGAPGFLPTFVGNAGDAILTYGREWSIHVSPAARIVTSFEQRFEQPGCLMIGMLHTIVRINTNHASVASYLDLHGILTQRAARIAEYWGYLDWQIRLDDQPSEEPAIYTFKAPDLP